MSDSMRPSAKDNDEPRWTPTKELSTLMLDSDKLDAIRAIINGDFDVTPFTYNGQDVRACDPLNRLRGHFFVDDASHCQCGKTERGAATHPRINFGPDPNCKRCKGTGEEPNAQFKCACRWIPREPTQTGRGAATDASGRCETPCVYDRIFECSEGEPYEYSWHCRTHDRRFPRGQDCPRE